MHQTPNQPLRKEQAHCTDYHTSCSPSFMLRSADILLLHDGSRFDAQSVSQAHYFTALASPFNCTCAPHFMRQTQTTPIFRKGNKLNCTYLIIVMTSPTPIFHAAVEGILPLQNGCILPQESNLESYTS
jgi:hypothetical protein